VCRLLNSATLCDEKKMLDRQVSVCLWHILSWIRCAWWESYCNRHGLFGAGGSIDYDDEYGRRQVWTGASLKNLLKSRTCGRDIIPYACLFLCSFAGNLRSSPPSSQWCDRDRLICPYLSTLSSVVCFFDSIAFAWRQQISSVCSFVLGRGCWEVYLFIYLWWKNYLLTLKAWVLLLYIYIG
jgi:hypothetical protein